MASYSSTKAKTESKESEFEIKQKIKYDIGVVGRPEKEVALPLTTNFKDEYADEGRVDKSFPEADNSADMFEDVDEDEIVDLTYEGIAHVDGVRHFVCESK
jgi:hypothetical protein